LIDEINTILDCDVAEEREIETNFIILIFHKIAKSNYVAVFSILVGWFVRFFMVKLLMLINHASGDVSEWLNLLYLLV
jgi:hypothetical protein